MSQGLPPPDTTREPEHPLVIKRVSDKDVGDIERYLRFEVARGFTAIATPDQSRFEPTASQQPETKESWGIKRMVDYRQQQLRDKNIAIAIGRIGDRVAATSVVALENGTMGKKLEQDEAWAAGTVVDLELQSQGIGTQMAEEQNRIATEAGKRFLLTVIDFDNNPSMRLRMNNVGYVLEGVEDVPEGREQGKTEYRYRKDLRVEREQAGEPGVDWVAEVAAGRVAVASEPINEKSPERILIDPGNRSLVKEAVDQGYKGVFLIRPEDGPEGRLFKKNYIVFVRETDAKE